MTKALTGLALADSVRRGEVRLNAPVGEYLDLGETAAAAVTFCELATHHSGYPRLGGRTYWSGLVTNLTAGNPYGANRDQLLAEARSADAGWPRCLRVLQPRCRDRWAGPAAAAAGLSYADYLRNGSSARCR